MTASSTPPDDVPGRPTTEGAANATTSGKKKRPILWMVVAGVAILAAIGLGVWAVKVHSDLEDQKTATQAAEAQAAAQADAAAAAEVEKINASNEVFVVSNEDVTAAEEAVADANAAADEANSAVSAAQDEASKQRAELEQAGAERDLARAERQQARVCARGSLGVISALGKSDEQATEEMQTVSSACTASVSG